MPNKDVKIVLKILELQVDQDSGGVAANISETNGLHNYSLEVDICPAYWLLVGFVEAVRKHWPF